MADGELFWIERPVAALPFRHESQGGAPKALQALIDCGAKTPALTWRLDWQALGADERRWIEGGEYLPALGFLWLERAAALIRWSVQHQQPVAILELPSRRLTRLSISDLMHVMGSDVWLADAQVALVWGFAHEALTHPQATRWPLPCRGAVYPSGDGLDVGWWAAASDIAQI